MRISHEFWVANGPGAEPWDYWIDTYFAILPNLMNFGQAMPTFIWLRKWWETYPVDRATGKVVDMYRSRQLDDPRKKG